MAVSSGPAGSLRGMGARFIGLDREQVFLMPPSVRDWVAPDSLPAFISDLVDDLDLAPFLAAHDVDTLDRHRRGRDAFMRQLGYDPTDTSVTGDSRYHYRHAEPHTEALALLPFLLDREEPLPEEESPSDQEDSEDDVHPRAHRGSPARPSEVDELHRLASGKTAVPA